MSWRRNPEEKERIRKLADEIFGTECYLCERKINVGLHEIHGLKHDLSFTQALAVKHPEDFVRLCYPCHKAVHWIMIHFALSWEEIKKMYV